MKTVDSKRSQSESSLVIAFSPVDVGSLITIAHEVCPGYQAKPQP